MIDANDACIGITDGDRIERLWSASSFVPRKHNAGGQSKERFARGREEALKHWLRKVVDIVLEYNGERELMIGGPGMTKDRFVKELPRKVRDSIVSVDSCCYTDENGLYEIMKKSRYC